MPNELFPQNTIALIWDFDKTLIPEYMQKPVFDYYQVDSKTFWDEVNALPAYYREAEGLDFISKDTIYLNHILTYVREGVFKGLNNQMLRKLGEQIEFYPGMPEFFEKAKQALSANLRLSGYDFNIENYIISTGLRQMILGSKIAPYVDGVWGCELTETSPAPGFIKKGKPQKAEGSVLSGIGYAIDNTSKTRALFEINKGSNKEPSIDVNSKIDHSDRRIPFENMIYIADGPSDIPVFSLIRKNGGRAYGVYKKGNLKEFEQVKNLQIQYRIDSFGEADYTENTQTYLWLMSGIREIADRIVHSRETALTEKVGRPPRHIV